jgi:hypothetical protein
MRKFSLLLTGVSVAAVVAVVIPAMAPSAGATAARNLLKTVAFYTVKSAATQGNGTQFCRSTAPASYTLSTGGTASQARNPKTMGPVSLSISGASGYATVGFYTTVGTLGTLTGYHVGASGPFGDNLWFDTNTTDDTAPNGPYFTWTATGTCLASLGTDAYGLGPKSTTTGGKQVLTVNDTSTFFMVTGCTHTGIKSYTVTLGELKTGFCAGITSTTPAALWLGITAPSGGTSSARITTAHLLP